jgi:hypothetical protein
MKPCNYKRLQWNKLTTWYESNYAKSKSSLGLLWNWTATFPFALLPQGGVIFLLHFFFKFAMHVILIMQAVLYEEYFKRNLERTGIRVKRKFNEK